MLCKKIRKITNLPQITSFKSTVSGESVAQCRALTLNGLATFAVHYTDCPTFFWYNNSDNLT